ncbi:MAG: 4Fe-4S dicluster domain-containing protein [Thermodesulfobacteriota bacterium]|nr:4Fe-4S dicluster domain-containing protein [Thermodesulfobacteriota bacterium]
MDNILLIDPEKCVGCRQCALSCSFRKELRFSLGKARITTLWAYDVDMFVPMMCRHCERPLCVDICPVDAISHDGRAVVIDQDRCLGCKMCMVVCPFGGVVWDPETRCMIKCDLCEGAPVCVEHCVYGALVWLPAHEAAAFTRQSGAAVFAHVMSKYKDESSSLSD